MPSTSTRPLDRVSLPHRLIPPSGNPIPFAEKLRTALFGGLAIGVTGYISNLFLDGPALLVMLASMGASTVILFCVPESPMARFWPVVGGHLLSGLIGIGCGYLPLETWAAAGLAVGSSVFVMHSTRCLHPPGGATTLVATLGGGGQGLTFLLMPLALNVGILLSLAALLNLSLLRRKQPEPPSTSESTELPPSERLGIRREDLHAALREMNSFVDASEDQLSKLYDLAATAALQRRLGAVTCADIMSRELVTVEFGSALEEAWSLLQRHRLKALPVIDRARRVIGIVTVTDFFRHARIDSADSIRGKLGLLLRPTPGAYSSKPEVVGQIMTGPVVTLTDSDPTAKLTTVFTSRRIHQIPIVDANKKLVGIVTETDYIGGMYKTVDENYQGNRETSESGAKPWLLR